MTNVLMLVMVVTNFAINYDVVGTRPIECPDYKAGSPYHCAVYHCESIYSKTDYTEIKTVTSNTYVVTTINDISYSNLTASVEVEKLSRSVREVKSAVTSEWEKVAAPKAWSAYATNSIFYFDLTNYFSNTAIAVTNKAER